MSTIKMEQPMFGLEPDSSTVHEHDLDILDEFLDKRFYDDQAPPAGAAPPAPTQQEQQSQNQVSSIHADSLGPMGHDEDMFNNFLTDEINKNDFLIFNQDATNTNMMMINGDSSTNSSFDIDIGAMDKREFNTQMKMEATTPVSADTNTSPKTDIFHTPNSIDPCDSASFEHARNILSQLKFGSESTPQFNNEFPKRYLEVDETSLPYKMNVDNLPSYSRVETQIKLNLSVSPPPPQSLVHLPGDTIAKNKLCLSAPLSDDVKANVLSLETFVLTASTLKPCNICIRCIRREQKRASRRKAGAVDNTNWSLDSVKRAIIFNSKEVFSFPATASPTTSSQHTLLARIVCYCRHHQEQKGFKLLFILKNSRDEILAKHLSAPIMIMDRKKNSDEGQSASIANSDTNTVSKPLSPTSFDDDSSEPHTSDSRVFKRKRTWSPELSDGFSITPQRKPSATTLQQLHPNGALQFSTHNSSTSLASQSRVPSLTTTAPIIQRVIPAQGPLRGGIEVTLLGANFKQGLNVKFGTNKALSTQCWSDSTIVTYLPPAAQPGQVVVSVEDPELVGMSPAEIRGGTSIFTYLDDTDRQMIELALQIVGLKMNGKLEDARNIARKIIGSDGNSSNGDASSQANFGGSVPGATFRELSAANDEELILQVVQLLPTNPNLSICTSEGQTLLHLSCLKGYYKLVSSLLQKGARVDARDVSGFTPLHYASIVGDRKSIELLFNCKAYAFAKADNGCTPEDVADANVLDLFKPFHSADMSRKYSSSSISSSIFSAEDGEWTGGQHVSRLTNDKFTSGDESDDESDLDEDNIEASDEESEYDYNDDEFDHIANEEANRVMQPPTLTQDATGGDPSAPQDKSLWSKVRNFVQEDLPRYDDLFPSKSSSLTVPSSANESVTVTATLAAQDEDDEVPNESEFQKLFFNQRKNFQNDKMLLFFWLPLLILIVSSFILISFGWKFEFNDQMQEFIRKTSGNVMLGNERFKLYLNRHLIQVNEAVTNVMSAT